MKQASQNTALDALGNQTRRDILSLLKEKELKVNEIAKHFPVSRPAISKHLRILEQAKLIQSSSSGTSNIFSLNLAGFSDARTYLDAFWDEALANFKEIAEASGELRQDD